MCLEVYRWSLMLIFAGEAWQLVSLQRLANLTTNRVVLRVTARDINFLHAYHHALFVQEHHAWIEVVILSNATKVYTALHSCFPCSFWEKLGLLFHGQCLKQRNLSCWWLSVNWNLFIGIIYEQVWKECPVLCICYWLLSIGSKLWNIYTRCVFYHENYVNDAGGNRGSFVQ